MVLPKKNKYGRVIILSIYYGLYGAIENIHPLIIPIWII